MQYLKHPGRRQTMKAWQKWTLVGAIWGLVSGSLGFLLLMAAFAHSPPSRITETIFVILFLPGYIGMSIMDWMDDFRLILVLSTLIGTAFGLVFYKLYVSLWKGGK